MKATFGVAIAIIAVVTSAVAVPAASAASGCSATSGVTVIVDFTHFAGGKVERGCAPGHPANGLIALHAAGFATAGTAQYGDAFVCRIDGLPTAKQEACSQTPSASASWAYWNARPSDSKWTYSALGVLDYHPQPGTIEAFAFGNHAQPGVAPSAAIPTTTTTTVAPPTTPPPVTAATFPVGPRTTDPAIVAPGATTTTTRRAPKPGTTKPGTAKHAPPKTTSTTATTRRTSPTSTTVGIVERSASGLTGKSSSSGSPIGAILAIVIVGGLGLGAFAFTRARRRRPT